MAQIKVYGLAETLNPIKPRLSDMIHRCVVETLRYPPDKRFHRFFPLDRADFVFPADRSERYTIIEISIFEGRTEETKKELIRRLFAAAQTELGLAPADLEITIFEAPRHAWGIRGLPGDELGLDYKVEI